MEYSSSGSGYDNQIVIDYENYYENGYENGYENNYEFGKLNKRDILEAIKVLFLALMIYIILICCFIRLKHAVCWGNKKDKKIKHIKLEQCESV